MATETAVMATSGVESLPYRRSWLQALVERIESLPGPTWVAYTVIALLSTIVIHTQVWSTGVLPLGGIDPPSVFWGILPVVLIWVTGYLEQVAGDAFDRYRPALTVPEAEVARLRFSLTVMPAVPSLVLALFVVVATAYAYIVDPVASGIAGVPPLFAAGRFLLECFNGSVLVLLLFQLVRQMRDVRRTLARSTAVDLFQPGPLYAFSRLTSRTGIVIVLFTAASLLVVPVPVESEIFLVTWAPYIVLPPVIAVLAFLLPLYGMHGRLVAEKERLQGETEARIKGLLGEVNRGVDARDLPDGLDKALAMMLQQRDIVARLPTWPWSTGTLRAFVTAILLPLGLFIVQRVLSQLF